MTSIDIAKCRIVSAAQLEWGGTTRNDICSSSSPCAIRRLQRVFGSLYLRRAVTVRLSVKGQSKHETQSRAGAQDLQNVGECQTTADRPVAGRPGEGGGYDARQVKGHRGGLGAKTRTQRVHP